MRCMRRERREKIVRPVYFQGVDTGAYKALSLDASRCGVCVLTDMLVFPGQKIKIYSNALWSEPVNAVAVWSEADTSNGYKVGFRVC